MSDNVNKPEWEVTVESLFGPDYIIPLSAVLGINRRTVERWRSGAVQMPDVIVKTLQETVASATRYDPRIYGSILRIMAEGHSIRSIDSAVRDAKRHADLEVASIAHRIAVRTGKAG